MQHVTRAPSRFSQASFIRELETIGVGRPSTYAKIFQILKERGYVHVDGQTLGMQYVPLSVDLSFFITILLFHTRLFKNKSLNLVLFILAISARLYQYCHSLNSFPSSHSAFCFFFNLFFGYSSSLIASVNLKTSSFSPLMRSFDCASLLSCLG